MIAFLLALLLAVPVGLFVVYRVLMGTEGYSEDDAWGGAIMFGLIAFITTLAVTGGLLAAVMG